MSLFKQHQREVKPLSMYSEKTQPFIIAHIVPTSVGAAIGGFAGDASPATRLLAGVADCPTFSDTQKNQISLCYHSGFSENGQYPFWGIILHYPSATEKQN